MTHNTKFTESTLSIAVAAFMLAGLLSWSKGSVQQVERKPLVVTHTEDAHERLVRDVRKALLTPPYYSVFDNLQFQVEGSDVILEGQTIRPALRSDAEVRVKRIEGVDQVINRIEVLPVSFFDDDLRLAVYQAIYRHPGLSRYALQPVPPIRIIVNNGNVTLVGIVAKQMDKTIANLQAKSVPGVVSVTDELRTEEQLKRAPAVIGKVSVIRRRAPVKRHIL